MPVKEALLQLQRDQFDLIDVYCLYVTFIGKAYFRVRRISALGAHTRDARPIRVREEGGRPIGARAHRLLPRPRPPPSSPALARRLWFRRPAPPPSSPTPVGLEERGLGEEGQPRGGNGGRVV